MKLLKILGVVLICAVFPCYAEQLHVVHNVFEGGFSINGYDLLFDEENKMAICLGDQFYIKNDAIENITDKSFRHVVLLADPNSHTTHYFNSRIMSDRKFFSIVAVEEKENSYEVLLEDGSIYRIRHKFDSTFCLQPGDTLSFQGLDYYAVGTISPWFGGLFVVAWDGSKHIVPLTEEELNIYGNCTSSTAYTLFFGGAGIEHLTYGGLWRKTWHYPFCEFFGCTIHRDGICLSNAFHASGLFKKSNPLFEVNTFRVRGKEKQEVSRNPIVKQYICFVEFFDFFPGSKFNVDNRNQLSLINDRLKFKRKVNEKTFLFENQNGVEIPLSLDLKGFGETY